MSYIHELLFSILFLILVWMIFSTKQKRLAVNTWYMAESLTLVACMLYEYPAQMLICRLLVQNTAVSNTSAWST